MLLHAPKNISITPLSLCCCVCIEFCFIFSLFIYWILITRTVCECAYEIWWLFTPEKCSCFGSLSLFISDIRWHFFLFFFLFSLSFSNLMYFFLFLYSTLLPSYCVFFVARRKRFCCYFTVLMRSSWISLGK